MELSKIPVPPHDDTRDAADKSTLIERVVRNYDLVRISPPPIPEELLNRPQKRTGRYSRKGDEAAAAPAQNPAPAAQHAQAPAATEPERPEVVVPEVMVPQAVPVMAPVAASVPVPAARAANVPAVQASRFNGERLPVNRQHLREQGLIVPEGSVTALLEEFRIVKRTLLLQALDLSKQGMGAAAQRILICSPHPGEGKTYTAVNLALSIAAEKETEVLLVDADFAKPSVLSSLGLPGGRGLMDALADPAIDVIDCVIGTDIPGLWVLPAGNATNSDSEFLTSARAQGVIDRLNQGAPNRIVIFDSPPALAASPAAELAKYVGQAVVVARADRTGQGALEDAISLLSACPNIQLLLNAVQFSPSGRRFGTYYGYGG
jgi:Mrp family chromosome partitioning ATPase